MGKIACITGATSGIGKAYATLYAAYGYDLILTGRRQEKLAKTADALSRMYLVKVTVCVVDFKDTQAFERFVDFIKTKSIEVLINNAGYGLEKSFMNDRLETQLEMVQVHIMASVTLAHIVAQKLKMDRRKGVIINVCSLAAFTPLPTSAMYCSTKAFLINFSKSLAMELKPFGIQVQALCPGFVYTDFHSRLSIPKEVCKNKGIVTWAMPEDIVKESFNALMHNQVFVVPGKLNRLAYYLLKCVPNKVYLEIVRHYSGLFSEKNQDEV